MIYLKEVSKRFGDTQAVKEVSVEIRDGSCLGIHGPSGGGKTTLLRLIAGLEVPDVGEIRFDGELASDPDHHLPPSRRQLGFVFQEPALWPHMTVLANVLFGLAHLPRPEARHRAERLLERLQISDLSHRYPAEVSGGQGQRVGIARALAPCPRHLLLDEPSTYLEPELRSAVMDVIFESARETEACVILVTHDPEEARARADEIREMRGGTLLRP